MRFSKPVSKDFTNASQLASNAQSTANTALASASQAIGSADGKNTNYFGTDHTAQSGSNGDLYYQTNTDKTVSMYQYNNGWQLIASDATGKTASSDLSKAKADLQSNIDQANSDIALAKADIANNKTDISNAQSDLNQAKTDIANNKNGLATVKQTAEENSSAISNNKSDISLVKQTAAQNTSDIANNKGDISALKQTATQNTSDIASSKGDISTLKQTAQANTSAIADNKGDISSLKQTTSGISSTVAQTQQDLANSGAPNLVYNSEYSNNGYGWNTYGIGYVSNAPLSMYNGSQGLEVNISGKGADTWTKFGESKHVAVPSTTVDNNTNIFSFAAMVRVFEHSSDAVAFLTLGFFDSGGNRIAFQNVNADSNKNDWQKVTFDGYAYPANAVSVSIQYFVYGDTMHAVVAHPIITQTSTNVPYHSDTANQSTVVSQTASQWSVFANKNGVFTGIKINADGTINMDASKVTISGDEVIGGTLDASKVNLIDLNASSISTGTLSSNAVSVNGSTGAIDQNKGDVPFRPWKWDSSTFNINNGFLLTTANNAVGPGSVTYPTPTSYTNVTGTLSPTYLKFTIWDIATGKEENRAYIDGTGIYLGTSGGTYIDDGNIVTTYISAYYLTLGNIGINNGHSFYSMDNGDMYFRGASDQNQINIHALALKSTSLLSQKTNLSPLSPEEAMDALLNTDIYKYQYLSDLQRGSSQQYASLIIDDVNATPQYKADKAFVNPEGNARDDGIIANYSAQAIKYLYQKLNDQQTEIDELKQEIKNMKEAK